MKLPICIFLVFFQFLAFSQSVDLKGDWEYKSAVDSDWKKCTLPNSILNILYSDSELKSKSEADLKWISETKFYFRKKVELQFDILDHHSTKLIMHNVDTYCRVFVNGDMIDTLDNYFRPSNMEIKDNLLPGENEIIFEFLPLQEVHKKRIANVSENRKQNELRMRTRKPEYMFGLSNSKNYPSYGIYGDMKIQSFDIIQPSHVNFKFLLESDGRAKVLAKVNVNVLETGSYRFESNLFSFESKILTGKNRDVIWTFFIDDFKYWYPKGMGAQHFYEDSLIIHFHRLEDKNESIVAKLPFKLSFHHVEMVQNPKVNDDFQFEIEGMEMEVKAALFRPFPKFPHQVTQADYHAFFKKVLDNDVNLIRIWGGGGYADDRFMRYCDSIGVLVWQDFAFTGPGFHTDSSFVRNVRKEIDYQLRRLSSHPSLVLFSGAVDVYDYLEDPLKMEAKGIEKKELKYFKKSSEFIFETEIPRRKNKFNSRLFYKNRSPKFEWKDQTYGFGQLIILN